MIEEWYEVWVDESPKVPYVLFVCPEKQNSKQILIIDPKENNQIIQQLPDYDTAVLWLTEDEYTRVEGRMEIE